MNPESHMPLSRRSTHRLAIAITAAALLAVAAPVAHACSLVSPWEYRSADRLEFIGTPLPDTLLAGAGGRTYVLAPGHFGRGTARVIYGQRVRVDQLGERARRALPDGVSEVLLVPWDYDAACRSVPWSRSARWLPDSMDGVFAAQLRPREHWAGDLPTLDIRPFMQPYRDPAPDSTVRDWLRRPRLSAQRMLRLLDELWPIGATLDSMQALAFAAQLRADTSLVDKWPATHFLQEARNAVNAARLRALDVPVVGTFRLSVTVGATPPRTLFVRTAAAPQPVYAARRAPGDSTLAPPVPAYYELYTSAASTMNGLAPECWAQRTHTVASVTMRWHGALAGESSRSFDGDLDPRLLFPLLSPGETTALQMDGRVAAGEMSGRMKDAQESGIPQAYVPPFRARFVTDSSGSVRVESTLELKHLGIVRVRGERINEDAMPCRL